MTLEALENEISRILGCFKADQELIALRNLLNEMDKATAIKLASTSMDPKVLCDMMPIIGPEHPEVYDIAEKRMKELFPKEYRKHQMARDIICHPRGLPVG